MDTPPPNFRNSTDGYQMILVPAGEAVFGSHEAEEGSEYDRRPQFRASLGSYYLGKYPVRNREYARFLDAVKPSETELTTRNWILLDDDCHVVRTRDGFRVRGEEGRPPVEVGGEAAASDGWADHPVVQVSWYGAQAYCAWAGLRLPTELEWEKGARGSGASVYPWGDQWDPTRCRNEGNKGSGRTSVVWEYPEGNSAWGHYQMVGNVWEWCEDWHRNDVYARYADGDLAPPQSGGGKVIRGGCWYGHHLWYFRCAYAGLALPGDRFSGGFRCARDVG